MPRKLYEETEEKEKNSFEAIFVTKYEKKTRSDNINKNSMDLFVDEKKNTFISFLLVWVFYFERRIFLGVAEGDFGVLNEKGLGILGQVITSYKIPEIVQECFLG